MLEVLKLSVELPIKKSSLLVRSGQVGQNTHFLSWFFWTSHCDQIGTSGSAGPWRSQLLYHSFTIPF